MAKWGFRFLVWLSWALLSYLIVFLIYFGLGSWSQSVTNDSVKARLGGQVNQIQHCGSQENMGCDQLSNQLFFGLADGQNILDLAVRPQGKVWPSNTEIVYQLEFGQGEPSDIPPIREMFRLLDEQIRGTENQSAWEKAPDTFKVVETLTGEVKNSLPYLLLRFVYGWVQFVTIWIGLVALCHTFARLLFDGRRRKALDLEREGSVFLRAFLKNKQKVPPLQISGALFDEYLALLRERVGETSYDSGTAGKWEASINGILFEATKQIKNGNTIDDGERVVLERLKKTQLDLSRGQVFVRTAAMVLLTLGFIGTVMGLSDAMGVAYLVADTTFESVLETAAVQTQVGILAVAFDTMLVALAVSLFLVIVQFLADGQDSDFQIELQRRLYDDFLHMFKA